MKNNEDGLKVRSDGKYFGGTISIYIGGNILDSSLSVSTAGLYFVIS